MHNLKYIRENSKVFKKKITDRNVEFSLNDLLELDKKNRETIFNKEKLEKEKKNISKSKNKSQFEKSKFSLICFKLCILVISIFFCFFYR